MVHPQKRLTLRGILDNTLIRMCEIKQFVLKLNVDSLKVKTQFVDFTERLQQLGLTPRHLQIPIPRYFCEDEKERVEMRNVKVEDMVSGKEKKQTSQWREEAVPVSYFSAIMMIQKIERGRQAIESIRGKEVSIKRKERLHKERSKEAPKLTVDII